MLIDNNSAPTVKTDSLVNARFTPCPQPDLESNSSHYPQTECLDNESTVFVLEYSFFP